MIYEATATDSDIKLEIKEFMKSSDVKLCHVDYFTRLLRAEIVEEKERSKKEREIWRETELSAIREESMRLKAKVLDMIENKPMTHLIDNT